MEVTLMEATVTIKGMHCASCAASIQTFLRSQDGIESADVDVDDEQARIEYTADTDLDAYWDRLEEMGYTVEPDDD